MNQVTIIYWSGTGNTEEMANAIAEGVKRNAEVIIKRADDATKQDIMNAHAVALGCPSMGSEVLEEDVMEPFVDSLSDIDWNNKPLALFGSYDWGDGEWMRNWEERMANYGASLIQEGLIVNLQPDEDDLEKCRQLGEKLSK